jgi:hypothetical protein
MILRFTPLRRAGGAGAMAGGERRRLARPLAPDREERGAGAERHLRRGARPRPLLRLDRQPEARSRRDPLPAALHPAAAARALVEDQPREGRSAGGRRRDPPGGRRRDRRGEGRRALGGRLRRSSHRRGPRRPQARARRQSRRRVRLRRARRRQPLRDPLSPRRGETARDPRPPPHQVRRHARARREDPRVAPLPGREPRRGPRPERVPLDLHRRPPAAEPVNFI